MHVESIDMKGKCNCGKKATCEYLTRGDGAAWSIKFCNDHAPKYPNKAMTLIDGK